MLNKLLLALRNKEATQVRAFFMLVLFVSALFCGHAIGQTEQTSLLPGNGAPLLVTPEVHLTSPAPTAGATNATAGNTAGATNQTSRCAVYGPGPRPVPQYAGPAYTITITPNPATLQGAHPARQKFTWERSPRRSVLRVRPPATRRERQIQPRLCR